MNPNCSLIGKLNDSKKFLQIKNKPKIVIILATTTTNKIKMANDKFISSVVNPHKDKPTYENAKPSATSDMAANDILVANFAVFDNEYQE
jgi:hypothetical protein